MVRLNSLLLMIPVCFVLVSLARAAEGTKQVIVYEGVVTEVAASAERMNSFPGEGKRSGST